MNPRTKESWVDGAVHYNNPVRIANYESMLLWPETKGNHPDILLSIGTAYNEQHPDEKPKKKKKNYKPYSEPRSWAKLIRRRIKDFLDAEQIWKTFRDDVVGNSSPIVAQRFVRVNPKLIIPVPKLDDHEASGLLRNAVGNSLASAEMTMLVEKVAHRLIASSFYFDKTSPTKVAGGATVIEGTYHSL